MRRAFTLLELMIVIAIISLLSVVVFNSVVKQTEKTYLSSASVNLKSLNTALQSYILANGGIYPPDLNRDIPPPLVNELRNSDWSEPPWPDSVYDWDNWDDPLSGEKIYQFSIRFCLTGNPASCKFPREKWAENFGVNSAVYFCVQGPCRSHISEPANYPGLCVNC